MFCFPGLLRSPSASSTNSSTTDVTHVFGVFRIVDSTSRPNTRKPPNQWASREYLRQGRTSKQQLQRQETANHWNATTSPPRHPTSERGDGNRWRHHPADASGVTKHEGRTRGHSKNEVNKASNYVTPPRYRPAFTGRTSNRSRDVHLVQKEKPEGPTRRPHSNRYYAYNTRATPKVGNVTSSPATLTTPELVISTNGPVPDELPLSLAIMVGEDPGVDVSSWRTKQLTDAEEIDAIGLVCTSVTTIAATAVTLSLVHVIGLAGAYCCFKWRRRTKRKKILQRSLEHHVPTLQSRRPSMIQPNSIRKVDEHRSYYAKPEVSFRNVYGSYESPP